MLFSNKVQNIKYADFFHFRNLLFFVLIATILCCTPEHLSISISD